MKHTHIKIIAFMLSYSILTHNVSANEPFTFSIINQHDEAVENVVITAVPQAPFSPMTESSNKKVIDQIDKQFIRHVTVIQKGSQVDFPNHDQIRHHVYSFSTAKPFEIPLYEGSPEKPILFDKTGVISLGCNIHDWMSAYIYVVDTPYFSITNKQGKTALDLPSGSYQIHYWHPNIDTETSPITSLVELSPESNHSTSFQINLKTAWKFRRGPLASFNRTSYR